MKTYLVNLEYAVRPPREAAGTLAPPVRDVLAEVWGPGHQGSFWQRHTLTVLAEVRADDGAAALEVARDKVAALWPQVGQGALRLTRSWVVRERALVGARRTGVSRVLRYRDLPPGALGARSGVWIDPFGRPHHGHDGDDEPGGGTAGVREPRRPKPSPGSLSAALDLPES